MSRLTIPFGPYLPDRASFRNPGVLMAKGVVPREPGSYGPLRELTAVSNALGSRCLGAVSARDKDQNVYVYAGDATRIYELVGGTFTDQSKGGGYSVATGDGWEFAIWDKSSKIIATDFTDAVQSMAIGAGSSSAFADLITGTNKPKAKHVAIIEQFLVLGNTNDAVDGQRPSRLWWSARANELNFDPDASTQSDFEDLVTGGWVQRLIGGNEYGLVFQTDTVRTMRYVGPTVVFEILPINNAPGTPIPNSVIAHKGNVFYIAEDGVFAIQNGAVTPIGSDKVDFTFWNQFDINNKAAVSAAVDPVRKLICWAFPGAGASSNFPNKLLMFKYDEGRFAEAEVDTEMLFRTETQGYTLDTLDTVGTNIDNSAVFGESFDSDRWKGGSLRFGAFDQAHKLGFFTGATRKAVIETGDIQPKDGMNWQINSVRPLMDGGTADISLAKRARLTDAVSYGNSSAMNTDGECPIDGEARYMRFRTSLTSSTSWEHIQGIQLDFEITGER